MENFNIILFIIIFLFVTQRPQIAVILSAKTRYAFKKLSDAKITKLVRDKTGTSIKTIHIVQAKKPYGLMVGIPTKPILILSSKLYETFTEDELEYVILHEAAHYKYLHSIREVIFSILLIAIGTILILELPAPETLFSAAIAILAAIVSGIILGIINIQFAYLSELQADKFAIRNMSNPAAIATAIKKFRKARNGPDLRVTIPGILFQRNTSGAKRIQMAELEKQKRSE